MKKLLVILLLSLPAFSQGLGNASIKHFSGVPSGSCNRNTFAQNDLTGFMYSCDTSQNPPVWAANPFGKACDSSGNCVVSGTLNVTGLATLAGGVCVLPGPTTDGTTALYQFATPSGANLVKSVVGDTARTDLTVQTADNTICTTIAANHGMFAHPGDVITIKADAIGLTAGHIYGLSGTTAATAVDLGANTSAVKQALTQPWCGTVLTAAAAGANASVTWEGCQSLLVSFSGTTRQAVSAGASLNAAAGTAICTDGSSQATTSGCAASGTNPITATNFGQMVIPTWWLAAPGTVTFNPAANVGVFVNVIVPVQTDVTSATVNLITRSASATQQCDFGLYSATGGTRLFHDNFECGSGGTTGSKTATFTKVTLQPGSYWFVGCSQVADTAYYGFSNATGARLVMNSQTQKMQGTINAFCTAGALPANFTPSSIVDAADPMPLMALQP